MANSKKNQENLNKNSRHSRKNQEKFQFFFNYEQRIFTRAM